MCFSFSRFYKILSNKYYRIIFLGTIWILGLDKASFAVDYTSGNTKIVSCEYNWLLRALFHCKVVVVTDTVRTFEMYSTVKNLLSKVHRRFYVTYLLILISIYHNMAFSSNKSNPHLTDGRQHADDGPSDPGVRTLRPCRR